MKKSLFLLAVFIVVLAAHEEPGMASIAAYSDGSSENEVSVDAGLDSVNNEHIGIQPITNLYSFNETYTATASGYYSGINGGSGGITTNTSTATMSFNAGSDGITANIDLTKYQALPTSGYYETAAEVGFSFNIFVFGDPTLYSLNASAYANNVRAFALLLDPHGNPIVGASTDIVGYSLSQNTNGILAAADTPYTLVVFAHDYSYDPTEGLGSGASVQLSFSPVPEPSTYALCALAGVVVLIVSRRRKAL